MLHGQLRKDKKYCMSGSKSNRKVAKKYRYGERVYIVSITGIVINGVLFYLINDLTARVVLLCCIGVGLAIMLNLALSFYMVTSSEIIMKSPRAEIAVPLNEIKYIKRQPAGKLVKESIVVSTGAKHISITALTRDYWELISCIIESISENNSVEIDSEIARKVSAKNRNS